MEPAAQIDADIRRIHDRQWNGDDDSDYAELLSQQTVALVGPARTLLGSRLGGRIDAHDLVVRFNDAFDVLAEATDRSTDIGTRLDVLYCNQVILKQLLGRPRAGRELVFETFHQGGLRFVVCANNSLSFTTAGAPRSTCDPGDRLLIAQFREALARHGSSAKLRVACAASETLSTWLNGHWARTGLVGILDLLTFDVRHLFITGMTFYHGGGHLLAPESAALHPRKNRDGTWAQSASGLGHDSYIELEVMKRLARHFGGVVEVDDSLAALLGCDPR